MNDRPIYVPGALSRIERLGEKSIAAFFNEIPRELLKVVTGILPPLAGFRPGTNAAVQRQLQSLAHKIAAHRIPIGFSRLPEETALFGLWRAWSQSQIAETTIVRELLDALDEDEDEDAGQSDKSEPMTAAMKALVASTTCARESLERFVIFSPFENIESFLTLAKIARTSAEIERDSALRDLPDRLHKDEARLQLLETKLDASDRNAALIRSDLDEVRLAVTEIRNKAAENRAAIGELQQTGDAAIAGQKAAEEALARLTHAIDRLVGRLTINERQVGTLSESNGSLERDVAQSAEKTAQLLEQLAGIDSRLKKVVADVQVDAAALKRHAEQLSAHDKFAERIDQLELMVLELVDQKTQQVVPQDRAPVSASPQSSEPMLPLERLSLESGISVKSLRTVGEVLSSLDAALVDAGLKKSMVTPFSEEILAAAASEQVVFLRGGFAIDVARKCALSLSGTSVFRVAIPLGLTDPSLLRRALTNRSGCDGPSSVVIEGINNSPLDLLRDILLDQVTHRVGGLGRQSPTVIFASLVDGAGGFPIEACYLELGPVFDLEQMDWRRLRREKLPVLGSIAQQDWQSIAVAWDGKTTDYDEALQGVKQIAHRRNTRIETNVVRAFSALKAIRREQRITPLQSVTFGWLAPYWQSLAAKAEDIDAQIDGGKCDATSVDERLKNLLLEYRNQTVGRIT